MRSGKYIMDLALRKADKQRQIRDVKSYLPYRCSKGLKTLKRGFSPEQIAGRSK